MTYHRSLFAGLAVDGPVEPVAWLEVDAAPSFVVALFAFCSGLLKNFRSAEDTFSRDRDDIVEGVQSIDTKRLHEV